MLVSKLVVPLASDAFSGRRPLFRYHDAHKKIPTHHPTDDRLRCPILAIPICDVGRYL